MNLYRSRARAIYKSVCFGKRRMSLLKLKSGALRSRRIRNLYAGSVRTAHTIRHTLNEASAAMMISAIIRYAHFTVRTCSQSHRTLC